LNSERLAPWERRGRCACVIALLALALTPGGELHAQWLTPDRAASTPGPASPASAAHLPLEPPPLQADRVALQLAGGVAGGALGTLVIAAALSPFTRDAEFGALTVVAAGVLIGYPPGAAGGVFLVGNRGPQRGSLLATLAGAAAGAVVALPLVGATRGTSYLALVPIGATVGFSRSRRPAPRGAPGVAGTGPDPGERLH
jgi:hypothetical protein